MRYYLSIEKNIEGFELYKALWGERGITGVKADTMIEGIVKAVEIEKSKTDELYFIAIVADDVDYIPLLQILSEETSAPVLIAASAYNDCERLEALNKGADHYGAYCETPEMNISAVYAYINSMNRRAKKKKPRSRLTFGNLMIVIDHKMVYCNDAEIELTTKEYEILYYLVNNQGTTMTYAQIARKVWLGEAVSNDSMHQVVSRLRKELEKAGFVGGDIHSVRGVGYRYTATTDS